MEPLETTKNPPIRTLGPGGFTTPFALIQAAYGGKIAPYTVDESHIPGLKLHVSLMLRRGVPGLLKQQTPLLVDVMTEEADELHELRNRVLAEHREAAMEAEMHTHNAVDIIMVGALAHPKSLMTSTSRPVVSVLWWDLPISWADYLVATASVRHGLLAAVMYRFNPGKPDASTLVVEAHTDLGACAESLDPRKAPDWYYEHGGIHSPAQTVPASPISLLLPAEYFCELYG